MPSRSEALSPVAIWSQLTRAISRTERLDDICDAALDALHAGLNIARSSILLFDADGSMRFKAWRGLSDAYRRAVEGHSPWTPFTRNAAPIIVSDVGANSAMAPFLTAFRSERIAALTFIPLETPAGVIGKFMLYYGEPHEPSGDELQIASLIAAQIAFAVERTEAQRVARASEQRLRFALDAADMGTWDWDMKAATVRWSENMERIHGLPPAAFDGTFASYVKEIHPDDREQVHASIERALTDGAPHDVEYRIVAPDGTIRWVHGKGSTQLGPDGTAVSMSGVCMNVTARKEAELARSEAFDQSSRLSHRLAAIVQSSDDAIVSKDLNGIIMSWNDGAERMFGYSAAEAVGKSILLIVPPDRHDEEDRLLARIRAGFPVEMETVRRRKDGRLLQISLKVSPIRDSTGRIAGASKIARDITIRKQNEAERTELERRLTLLVEASASLLDSPEADSVRTATVALARQLLVADAYAVWVNETDGRGWRIVKADGVSGAFATRVIESYRGAAAPASTPFSEPLAIEDIAAQPLVEEQLAAYRDEGIYSMLVCPMRLGAERAGTLVFYYRTPHTFRDIDAQTGQALANLAAAALTTAGLYGEQRTRRALAEKARHHATFLADATSILSRSPDHRQTLPSVAELAVPEIADWCAVDVFDDDGRLQRVAVAGPRDAGEPGGASDIGQHAPIAVQDIIRLGKPASAQGPAGEGVIEGYSARDLGAPADMRDASFICVPLVSTSGAVGALTFVRAAGREQYGDRDLTFATEVAVRTALAIDNALAYRRAREANRLKDEFLATLSHELRTPLNAILGYAQMLNLGVLRGERHTNAIAVVTRNAEALRQIIDDVLDVSRITSGKLRLNVRALELDDILGNALSTVQPAADAKGVALRLRIDPGVGPVSVDPDRLQQVVWNLLSNAVKFTARGGHIDVELHRGDTYVEILVRDDGQGIDASFLPHIFERFRQADSRFAREHGGLGLGLAIVRELVELHGGSVSAASEGPGTGATFRVRLPAIVAPTGDQERDRRTASDGAVAPAFRLAEHLAGVRILAVDDEEDALGLLRIILESAGAQVTTAGSAERALDLIQQAAYDALIADLGMPRMDGLELIRAIRSSFAPHVSAIPAAALTAYARSEDRAAALASGFHLHIAKPVNPAELVAAIASLLGRPV